MAGELSHNESLGLLKEISNLYLDISSEQVEVFSRYNDIVLSYPEMTEVRDLHVDYYRQGISSLVVAFESVFTQVEFENEIFDVMIPSCSEINRVQIGGLVRPGLYGLTSSDTNTGETQESRSFAPETPWGGRVLVVDVIGRINEKLREIRKAEEFLSTPALYGTANHFLKAGIQAQINSLNVVVKQDISKILCRPLMQNELDFFYSLGSSNLSGVLKMLSHASATLDPVGPFKRYIVFPVTLRGKVVPDTILNLLHLVEVY